MVENDTFTYHVKKPLIDHKSSGLHSLITQERTRQLELLIHLIANSKQAIVVCGPEGVGKTTMLKVLQERNLDSWLYCLVQCNSDLSFEKIQELTSQVIEQDQPNPQTRTLSSSFKQIERQHKKILLMFDNAGYLVPGLINTIIKYATKNPVLRVIFVLSYVDLEAKNLSDNALDDCHIIEVPPLSEKQCGEFLQYLTAKPHSQLNFNEISDDRIASVYSETQGIPGRIIAELPVLDDSTETNNSLWILIAAVACLVAVALGVQWFSGSKYNIKPAPMPVTDMQKSAGIESGEKK